MKLSALLARDEPTLSFEVFPPRSGDSYESVAKAVSSIAALRPAFMSVTCRTGGGEGRYTEEIAASIQNDYGVPSLAHLTCFTLTRAMMQERLARLKALGVQNIMALRGDIPESEDPASPRDYRYASEMIRDIRRFEPDLCVGGACYPEGHVESVNKKDDILHLREKVDAGCDFLTTQMFFDNSILYNFLYRIREAGITVPIVAGIMPVTHKKQIQRICSLSGTYLPAHFKDIVDRFGGNPKAMAQAGVVYATEQIIDLLANGVNHIHIDSLNHPRVAAAIQASLSEIL